MSAYNLTSERTDRRVAVLQDDPNQRRALQHRLDPQLRRDACVLTDGLAGQVPDSSSASPQPPPPTGGGLICLPLLGCVL